ncbi:cellulose biosynthesis protein BcsS [Parablastomonas sp. CN1-191]|uniref:cellulose biosynthesis protein BcsS n=1 Tax=Parablastomonas sp. CN1-191 TaxID=3400908 RepID=UPI003BF7ADD9
MPKAAISLMMLGAAFFAVPQAAFADDSGVVYAGGGVGNGDGINGYAGGVFSLPGSRLGQGWAIRAGGSGGRYQYESGTVGTVRANYASAELAAVYQTSGDWGWANFGAGPRITHTSLTPSDPANRMRGTRYDLALQTDGAYGQDWRLGWFGSLGVNDRTYITQARLGKRVNAAHNTRMGIEGIVQGDRIYTQEAVGAFVTTGLGPKAEISLSGGASFQTGRSAKPYASVGISHVF